MTRTAELHPFSVPRYPSSDPTQRVTLQLLVTQDAGQQRQAQLLARIDASELCHLALPQYADEAALGEALGTLLSEARVGVHLELHGDEAFIWSLRGVARAAGLLAEEITLHCSESGRRMLFCVHCASLQVGTSADLQACSHCAVLLEVRRHFSERLGAYLGVCADADQPYAQARP
ncbi:hypothetical protein M2262_005160 [Pseudomonas sp. BIGb0408]|uniref:Dimethylamine monooxygenase subunit DmmA-like C-terminal domain-containing protein n=1 Tax=Phytopseudomonas flavescens TaxID=29435 RepID=A0A7Y9XSJ7_9GAMM|nr:MULTISPECIES: dimethylamine monooxygenase subunit DmmA family protein [Pseudomonas]MCW2295110.1 hypothetical protein [Pseudomonas sp. BIGb0408]NYH75616.1 hypothetical protein [Pseudomonas flavescens]